MRRQPFGHSGAFFGAALPCILGVVYDKLGHAFLRLFSPHPVDWIAFDRNKLCALCSQCLGCTFDPAFGVNPSIIANARTGRGMVLQPVSDARLGHAYILPIFAVDLLAYLQRVTAIGEDSGLFG